MSYVLVSLGRFRVEKGFCLHKLNPLFIFRGVNAVSFSSERSCVYSAGADGMVCQTDPASGNLLEKFKASGKAISSMVISPGMFWNCVLSLHQSLSTLC